MQANASIALGTSEVTLVELTSSYRAFHEWRLQGDAALIRRHLRRRRTVLYETPTTTRPVLDPAIVSEMNRMMVRRADDAPAKMRALPAGRRPGRPERRSPSATRCSSAHLHTSRPASGSATTTEIHEEGHRRRPSRPGLARFHVAAHEVFRVAALGTTGVQPVSTRAASLLPAKCRPRFSARVIPTSFPSARQAWTASKAWTAWRGRSGPAAEQAGGPVRRPASGRDHRWDPPNDAVRPADRR